MFNYQNIAVAVDFSEQSLKALDRAILISKNNGAKLVLVHVVDTKSFGSITAYDLGYAEKVKEETEKEMEKLKNQALAEGVTEVETLVKDGSPKRILTTLPDIELIICGESGYNAVEKFVLGSVAERIVRYSKYDVLVVR